MIILQSVCHETIWGGDILKKYREDFDKPIGHLYMVNGHKSMSNTVLNGKDRGKSLYDVFKRDKKKWNLEEYEEFPLTVALVEAKEHLSIQVHPDDETAALLEGKKIGKLESWIFLQPPVDGWIYNGCECKTKTEVVKAVENGEMEKITTHYPVEKDEYVCVEAGTLHAMTAGSFVYEIEYGSDFTYRFYDYFRKDSNGNMRELHIEKAVQAIKPERMSRKEIVVNDKWISEVKYEICRKKDISCYKNESEKIECLSVLDGVGAAEGCSISGGMTVLLFPDEKIENMMINDAIIARLK